MGGGESKLTGPDLTKGVAASEVPDGGVLLGHAAEDAVLLARRGAEVYAVGASCTHYGAPLADGLVVGEEIRCPWHHACFSLRTGEALRAPALNPIACFEVETRDGQLFVLGKREPSTLRRGSRGPGSVVIVGAGAAGNACAEMLRREGYGGAVTMLGAEPTMPVDRPNLSKDYLAGNAPEEWMTLRGEDFYRDRDVEVLLGARVKRLDLAGKHIVLEDGATRAYGALVLATGADPLRLPLPGADPARVFTLRTLADSRAIIARAASAKRVVILGAGFIGLEVAASLRARGLEVDVVAPESVPLANRLGDALGAFVLKVHEEHGVRFHLGTKAKSAGPEHVELENGERLAADFVVAGAGVRPEVALAEQAGLALDRGIAVDEYLRTSAPDIWAAGDAARWPDARTGERIRVEHWVVAERMGQIAAKNALGIPTPCDLVPFFWSAHYDATINVVGHAERWDRVDVSGSVDARDAAVALRRGGKTLAVATIGRDRAALEAEDAMEHGDEAALARLVPRR
jgi:NADPH-dependent 2,4-dienoyl-CoA reductase/sulfur reductase-like enzyme/nitrite reductase/ring-hydroxylating ferredoxin subunit